MLVAAAATASVSCQKEENAPVNESKTVTLTMNAAVEETKTYIDEDLNVLWGKGEAVKLYVGSGETAKFFDSASTNDYDGEESASFTFEIKGVTEADSYTLGGIYPASAAIDNTNPKSFKVALPATQNTEPGKYDPSAYIMVLKPDVVEQLPSEYEASFRRAVALNKITLTNVAEDITAVEITVPNKKYLAGRRYFDLTTGESGEIYDSGSQTNVVKVNGDFKAGVFDVWFCSWGVELVEGDALTVKMTSANNTYTRTITTRAEGIKFVEGRLNTLTISMASAEVEAISTIAGNYLIASKTLSGWFLMTPENSNNFYGATENVSSSSDVTCADFYGVVDVENYVWNVAKYDGGYSIQSIFTNKYVTYSGSDNKAYANDELSAAAKMDIQLNGQAAVIESMNVAGRKLKYNASSPRFAFYETGQTDVYMIPWTPDTAPRINVTDRELSVDANVTTVDIPYTVKNITGDITATVADGATMTIVSASVEAEKVVVSFEANEASDAKTATIVLSYKGEQYVNVVITQAGKSAEGVDVETWTWEGGGKSDFEERENINTYGLGSDYAESHAPYKIKFDTTGDYFVIKVAGAIQNVSVAVKMIGGASTSYLDIQGSTDGEIFTSVQNHTISGKQNTILGLTTTKSFDASYRYVKFYFTKGSNIGVGPINITYIPDNTEGGETPEPEQPTEPVQLTMSEVTCSAQTANALTFKWDAVDGAIGYEVSFDGEPVGTITETTYTAAGLNPETEYELSVKAIGDGTYYLDSEAKTCSAATITATDEPSGNTYMKYTGTLIEGDYIIVYQSNAMTAIVSSSRLANTAVSPSNDAITNPDNSIVWHIAKNGDYWTIYNEKEGKYAASTGAKNKAQLLASGTDAKSLWTVTGTGTYEFVNKANNTGGVNSNLRNNGNYGFACYATSTGGALTLYKKN